ncbi:MAG: ABC transporter substrate-binding protein [Anaerolineae bacterium]|nr:ABC transporter substrate-binding protein [Anaerolineae bacterium]
MNRLKYKNFFVLLLLFSMLLAACSSSETSPTPEPQAGGETTSSTEDTDTPPSPPDDSSISKDFTLDPATTSLDDEDSLMLAGYIYDGLTRLNANGEVEPALARSWIVSEDGLDYVFDLRSDAVFSDGTPVTADIVAANFNRWFDPENALHGDAAFPAWEMYFLGFKGDKNADETPVSSFDGIEKVDNLTVLIHLNKQVPDLLEILAHASFSILNPDALASGDYGTSPAAVSGTGAYAISEWSSDKLALIPSTTYWGTSPAGGFEFTLE